MSGRNWTPYEIEIILHHYCSFAKFERDDAPAYAPCRDQLIQFGVLEWRDGIPKTTKQGDVLVEMLLQTPMPQNVWLDPRTGKQVTPEHPYMNAKGEGEGVDWIVADGLGKPL
jgi:hypothetical protein